MSISKVGKRKYVLLPPESVFNKDLSAIEFRYFCYCLVDQHLEKPLKKPKRWELIEKMAKETEGR